jgi:dTDP-4-dehydrorhamnose 3,5-epimerase
VIFAATPLPGVWLIAPERVADNRGFFARTYDREAFAARGLDPAIEQCSVSFNHRRGTVRGLHFQAAPHAEAKLVRCTRGVVWDVAIDLRPESPAFGKRFAAVLSAEEGMALYIPRGCAHGFQTLEDGTEVFYQISTAYAPGSARGYRYDDPAFGIPWPEPVTVISQRDLSLPRFVLEKHQVEREPGKVGEG